MDNIKIRNFKNLKVRIFSNRALMGAFAAADVADKICELLLQQKEVRMIFAAAPSQNELLANLARETIIDWSRITAFHMDEYIGLEADAPQRFGNYLKEHIFEKVPFKAVHYLNLSGDSPEKEIERYTELLEEAPIDIICMGIGENGHIAFNDPPVADFNDPKRVKVVNLDHTCRQQQVNDGCFAEFKAVPETAMTLTVPTLFAGRHLFVVVPGPTKARAVYSTLTGAVTTQCPASILTQHPSAVLYLDKDSAELINN